MTEFFLSPHEWWPKAFCHQLCDNIIFFSHHTFVDLGHPTDDELISTIDLVMEFDLAMKFGPT